MKVLECCAAVIQWKDIEKSPEMWARAARIPELVAALKKASDAYYNTGESLITDRAWDKLYAVLEERSPANPFLKKVGTAVSGRKVRLPYFMPSLNKKKDAATVEAYLQNYSGPYVLSEKLDGISLLIDYLGNGSFKLYTRGNGSAGQDVTNLAQYLKIPAVSRKMAVRAEVIIPKSQFEKLAKEAGNDGSFNLRNMVSGLVNRTKGESPELRSAKVVAYEIIAPNLKPSDQFARLKGLGFTVAPHKIVEELTIDELNSMLVNRTGRSPYDIDGIVVSQDKRNARPTSGNPDYAFAFKNTALATTYEATVVAVEWNASKDGYLKPRVQIEPIKHHTGVTITYVTAYNALYVYENKIGPGAVITLIRSGEVIPKIQSVVKKARRPQMPDADWDWNETGVDAVLKDSSKSNDVLLRRLLYFFTTLGVEGLRSGTIARFIDIGLNTPIKIIKASVNKMMEADGIQETTARKVRQNIDKALQNATLPTIMAASGLFGRNMGVLLLNALVDAIPNIMSLAEGPALQTRVSKVPGFSVQRATQFMEGLPKFKKFYDGLGIKAATPRVVRPTGDALSGAVVVFTGFRDASLKEAIEKNGGTVGNSVSSKTTILLVKDASSGSTKTARAQELGIKIMTADVFRKRFKL